MACECTCPYCHKPLTAKKGEIREHHFAHLPNQTCNYHNKISALLFAINRVLQGNIIKIDDSKAITINKLIDNKANQSHLYRDFEIDTDQGKMNLFILLKKDPITHKLIEDIIDKKERDGLLIDLSKEYNSKTLTEKALYELVSRISFKKSFISYKKTIPAVLEPSTGRPMRQPLTDYQRLSYQSNEKKTLLEWGKVLNPERTYLYKFAAGGAFAIKDPVGQLHNTGRIMVMRKTGENSYLNDTDMTTAAQYPDWKLIGEVEI